MVDRSRILTTGAEGMLGSYVDFGMRTSREMLDITDRNAVQAFVREHRPLAILHLAAATNLDECERDPARAYDINAIGAHNVASAASDVGATLIYVSTDAVFRGDAGPYSASDEPDPISVYGRTKYCGEMIVARMDANHLIVRTSWVFGGGPTRDTRFVGKIMAQLGAGALALEVQDDAYSTPTYGKDFLAALLTLLDSGERGTFHVVNSGSASRFEMAEHIAKVLHSPVEVKAVRSEHFDSLAKRGTNTALISSQPLRPWRDALTEYLEKEWHAHEPAP